MINKKLDNLIRDIESNTEEIDVDNNIAIKELFNRDKSRAIELILKTHKNYYYEIISSFHNLTHSFLVGAVLDSIYEALRGYDLDERQDTYTTMSGTILKNKLLNKIKADKTDKRILNSDSLSLDELEEKGYSPNTHIKFVNEARQKNLNVVELVDYIETCEDLSDIQKEIVKVIIKHNGNLYQLDIADKLGVSRQVVAYHLKQLKEKNILKEMREGF
jgi:DNA-binding transcriptional ArsR family regulator